VGLTRVLPRLKGRSQGEVGKHNITSYRLGTTETGFLDPQRNENPDVWSSVDADDDRTLKDPRVRLK
jgi:hypothetical protein